MNKYPAADWVNYKYAMQYVCFLYKQQLLFIGFPISFLLWKHFQIKWDFLIIQLKAHIENILPIAVSQVGHVWCEIFTHVVFIGIYEQIWNILCNLVWISMFIPIFFSSFF